MVLVIFGETVLSGSKVRVGAKTLQKCNDQSGQKRVKGLETDIVQIFTIFARFEHLFFHTCAGNPCNPMEHYSLSRTDSRLHGLVSQV